MISRYSCDTLDKRDFLKFSKCRKVPDTENKADGFYMNKFVVKSADVIIKCSLICLF